MPVIKDLVPDLKQAYAQYASIEPWLKTKTPPPPDQRTSTKSRRAREAGWIMGVCPLFLLFDILSKLLVEWRSLFGPAALLQAYRWIADSRDEETGERLDDLEKIHLGSIDAIQL